MKTTIFLIRHGEIDNPKKIIYGRNVDLKLSFKGKEQINLLAKKIRNLGYKINKIYTSPLLRATQSSDILSKVLGIKTIKTEQNLIDDDVPGLAGKPLEMLSQFNPAGIEQYSEKYVKLNNESRSKVIRRVKRAFLEILKKNEGETIIIVTHGNPISFSLFYLLNPLRKIPPMKVLLRNYPKKGSAVRLVIEDGKVLEKEYIS